MNIYDFEIPQKGEMFDTLLRCGNVEIKRIVSAESVKSSLYIQDEDEWVVLLEGDAELEIKGKAKKLKKGDTLFIPARTPHKVTKTSKGALWLAVHIH
ncbi:cupin domain-containing protein [Nitrosophilus alvini]|uniref:cupin domain-containing protein n=1 Tax=Nitrosophilus alvini TaxID=2714855 RepID=UPI00190AD8CB|nr:cupin domain-containing protein [Nitrosophilus alvini]